MALSLSIKNVSDDVARALRERAARNHRSIQGELLDILENAVRPRPFAALELQREVRALGLKTPSRATRMIRADRKR